jgi:CRP/FNR family transcriptional regulator, cAMP and macrophage regulator
LVGMVPSNARTGLAALAPAVTNGGWARLSEDELRALGDAAEVLDAPAGARLLSEGQRVDFIALLERGEIELYRRGNGRRIVYEILRRGDLLGAVPFLTGTESAFSARALQPVRLFVIRGEGLGYLLATRGGVARVFMLALARRVDRVEHRLVELIAGGLRSRVAALLLDEAGLESDLIRLPQATLAGLLGASRPRVNQILKEFEHEGLVRLTYRRVEVLDREQLLRIAA